MSCYMRRKELLARDGITNSTLYRWVEQKRFPAPSPSTTRPCPIG